MSDRSAVLSIAGSDSGGGAGIQADIRAITARGVHAATAITAITAQNSREVSRVLPLPIEIVEEQIDAVMRDLEPETVKIGMLGTSDLVRAVAGRLRQWSPRYVVLDPVMIASSGARLLAPDAVTALGEELLPLATIVTPNWPEAEVLLDPFHLSAENLEAAAARFRSLGGRAVLFKGGHLGGAEVVDTLVDETGRVEEFRSPRIENAEGHGTGCALAAALAAGLALGESLDEACGAAIALVHRALEGRYATGASRELFLDIGSAQR